jgi:hypothetical protein
VVGAVAGMLVALSISPAYADPGASAGGSAAPGYNAIPAHVSENVPSVGFEATSTSEFGDAVGLSGKSRTATSMSVLFSSWGCQSGGGITCVTTPGATFDVPLTFTVYASDPAGTLCDVLAQVTEIVAMPYRPSASAQCTNSDGSINGKWFNSSDKGCYNGFSQTVTMGLPAIALTDQVVWTVAYNTSDYGYAPIGHGTACYAAGDCGYDSLNVGVQSFPNAPFSGTDLNEDLVFVNSTWSGMTSDGWAGYRPLGAITTTNK